MVALALAPGMWTACSARPKAKNWIWMTPVAGLSAGEWKAMLEKVKKHGFDAVLPEVYTGHHAWFETSRLPMQEPLLEKLIEAGRDTGVEIHAWIHAMPNNIPEYFENHPDWYAVNRTGESAAISPAYVPYYRFMCSSHPEVQEFVRQLVADLASCDGLTGVHLDYIRLPDVILAEGLWSKYNIVQDREYPQYDYCYCDKCRAAFMEKSGVDPLTGLEDPVTHQEWRQFRYDTITHLVNDILAPEARKAGRTITAAVFPNWESVRQEWRNWNLDGYLPMLYHNFYNAGLPWIGEQLTREIGELKIKKPVYSGLFVPSLRPGELEEAFRVSMDAGASGISLFNFNAISEEHWKTLEGLLHR